MKQALIVVDMQNDFVLPSGTLYVPGAEEIVNGIEKEIAVSTFTVLTMDAHEKNHVSFKAQGGPWPEHCVAATRGCYLAVEARPHIYDAAGKSFIIHKGQQCEAYSGFHRTGLDRLLTYHGITNLKVVGVATDYCVKATVLDALKLGYQVNVIRSLIVGLDKAEEAIKEMQKEGAVFV